MPCTIPLLDLATMRAGDMISWHRRPLHLTSDPRRVDGEWSANGTWEGYEVRVTQRRGEGVLVWLKEMRNFLRSALACAQHVA